MEKRFMLVTICSVTLLGVALWLLGTGEMGRRVAAGPRLGPASQTMTGTLGLTKTAYLPFVAKTGPLATNTPVPPTATSTATSVPPTPTLTATSAPGSSGQVMITHIEYNPSGSDAFGEYVDLRSADANAVNMTGWTLRDEANTVFTFPTFELGAGASVRVWVRSGVNNGSNLYWGRDSATWNNDGDTAILMNGSTLVDSCSYGGGGSGVNC